MNTTTRPRTPKMQAQIDNCPLVARSNRGCFAAQAQVQVSDALPSSHYLYSVGTSRYMVPAVYVRVSVPDFDQGWGYYEIVSTVAVPTQELRDGALIILSQAEIDARVERAVAQASEIVRQYRNA